MRFIMKLLFWLVIFALGVISGFMLSPAKQGFGNTVNYYTKEKEEPAEEEELGI